KIKKDIAEGKYWVRFVYGTITDGDLFAISEFGAKSSAKNALSSLGAALNVSKNAFIEYQAALFSSKWHMEGSLNSFEDDEYLIKIANTVPELRLNQDFRKHVRIGTFDRWSLGISQSFEKSGVPTTPTLIMSGKKITSNDGMSIPLTEDQFTAAIEMALKG
ncbi:thioredoxin domain-containing protein, partial [Bacillus subtilis]